MLSLISEERNMDRNTSRSPRRVRTQLGNILSVNQDRRPIEPAQPSSFPYNDWERLVTYHEKRERLQAIMERQTQYKNEFEGNLQWDTNVYFKPIGTFCIREVVWRVVPEQRNRYDASWILGTHLDYDRQTCQDSPHPYLRFHIELFEVWNGINQGTAKNPWLGTPMLAEYGDEENKLCFIFEKLQGALHVHITETTPDGQVQKYTAVQEVYPLGYLRQNVFHNISDYREFVRFSRNTNRYPSDGVHFSLLEKDLAKLLGDLRP